jgi:tRNA(Arg) A34 adenosine deaminase TadA
MDEQIDRRSLILTGAMTLLSAQLVSPGSAYAKNGKSKTDSIIEIPKDLDHEKFMKLALERAKQSPKLPFGAVAVNMKTKEVIAGGSMNTDKKAIWHGEMMAINGCPDTSTGFNWKEVVLYTTAESCPMCQSAILWQGIPLVVYGSSMPYLIGKGWGYVNIRAQDVIDKSLIGTCQLIPGIMEKECNQLFLDAKKA